MDPTERESVEKQLESHRDNLRLLLEKRAGYVEPSQIPLELESSIRHHQREIERIEGLLAGIEQQAIVEEQIGDGQPTRVVGSEKLSSDTEQQPMAEGQIAGRQLAYVMDKRDFVNRQRERVELEDLNGLSFIQIFGPAGYGKTYLLARIQSTYVEEYEWVSLWLSFKDNKAARYSSWQVAASLAEQLGGKVDGEIEDLTAEIAHRVANNGPRVVLFFDSIELARSDVLGWIEDVLLHDLQYSLRIDDVRAFFASRYEIPRVRKFGYRFGTFRLSHFRERDVGEMLEYFAKRDGIELSTEKADVIVKNLIDISGGHPKCVKLVIDRLSPAYNPAVDKKGRFLERKKFFLECVRPVIYEEILSGIPDEDLDLLTVICTFRLITPDTIRILADKGYLPSQDLSTVFKRRGFLKRFADTGLLVRLRKAFIHYQVDPAVRNALTLELLFEDDARYLELHEEVAVKLYLWSIRGKDEKGDQVPHALTPERQITYIAEALYHTCRVLQVKGQNKDANLSSLMSLLTDSIRELRPDYEMSLSDCLGELRDTITSDPDLTTIISDVTDADDFGQLIAGLEVANREG